MIYVKHTYVQTITGWFDAAPGYAFYYQLPPVAKPGDVLLSVWAMAYDGSFGWGWSSSLGDEVEPQMDLGPGFGTTEVLSWIRPIDETTPSSLGYNLDPEGHGDGNHVVMFILLGGVDAGMVDDSASVISVSAVSTINAPTVTTSGKNRGVLHFAIAERATTLGLPGTDSYVRSGAAGPAATGRTIACSFQHWPGSGVVPAATFVDSLAGGASRYMGALTVALTPKPTTPLYSLPIQRKSSDVDWRFFLANSKDMSPIGEVSKARQPNVTMTLNRGGSLTFDYNGEEKLAENFVPLNTCMIAYRDGIPRWSGPIWSVIDDLPSSDMKVTCVGWFDLLMHRLIAPGQEPSAQFVLMDAGQIGMNLLCFANGRDASQIVMTPITPGQVEPSQIRTRSYRRFQNIGQEIQVLGDIESGYDCEVTPDTRVMNIWTKRSRDLRDSVVFGYLAGPVHNLVSVNRQISGDRTVNGIYVVGASPAATLTRQDDLVSQATYGLMEEQVALSEVVDPLISLAYAAGELTYRSNPLTIYTIKPMPWSESNQRRVPRPLEDYEVGDVISFSANQGRIHVYDQAARVFQMGIQVDGKTENVTLQTTLGGS